MCVGNILRKCGCYNVFIPKECKVMYLGNTVYMIVSSVMVIFNQDIIDHKQKGKNMYCYKTDPPTTEQWLQTWVFLGGFFGKR